MSIKNSKKKSGGGNSSCKLSKIILRYPDDKTQYNEEKLEDIVSGIENLLPEEPIKKITPNIGYAPCPLPIKLRETVLQIVIKLNNSSYAKRIGTDLFNKIFTEWGSVGFWGNYEISTDDIMYINLVSETINMRTFVLFIKQSPSYLDFGSDKLYGSEISCDQAFLADKQSGGSRINEIRWWSKDSGSEEENGSNCYIVVDTDFYAILYYLMQANARQK